MNKYYLIMVHFIAVFVCFFQIPAFAQGDITMSKPNAYQFSFKTIDGEDMPLEDMKGKVLMLVNTASKCGFTGQYKDLQTLYDTYKDDGLVVIGVPSGDFAGQEYAEEEQVKEFTDEKFNITFPLTDINHVKGGDAHPFYKWAKKEAGFLGGPKWNFHKYIIDVNGDFVTGFATPTSPTSDKVQKVIKEELAKVPAQ